MRHMRCKTNIVKLIYCAVFALIFSFFIEMNNTAFADDDIDVIINGEQIYFDVQPCIMEGRTMVPMRKIFEELGSTVEWVPDANLIIATKDTNIIAMEIGVNTISITDIKDGQTIEVNLDVPPVIIEDRTLVPLRAVAEVFGYEVIWDDESRTVIINSGNNLQVDGIGIENDTGNNV